MKSADSYTINQLGIPALVLMERAALKVVEVLHARRTDLKKVLVVCGSGNNGGDGFAVARLLWEKDVDAEILFVGKENALSKECALQKEIACRMGIPVFTHLPQKEYTVMIDAVFGVGLKRNISGAYADVIDWMNQQNCQKVAIDIPSGVCSRTGHILGIGFRAHVTVAMECVKLGSELFPGKTYSGETVAVPIGVSKAIFREDEGVVFTYEREELRQLLPPRTADSHKGNYGRVLLIAGSKGMAGAGFLAARGAYSTGAGLVQIYTPQENRQIVQQLLPEAIVTCYEEFDAHQLSHLLEWADVVCIGCGLGKRSISEQILIHTLKECSTPCVIDADGINLLSENMHLLKENSAPVILTPHILEMSRLIKVDVETIKTDRMSILHKFTDSYPVVCVLKDSRTAVAEKSRSVFLNLAGNHAMAKAGSGDVLAGTITGFAAQGMDSFQSACAGVLLHACGGDEARRIKGQYSVLAEDIIAGMEKVLWQLSEGERQE